MADNFADGYVDVATRCKEFFTKYPEGSLQPADPTKPFEIVYLDDDRAKLFTSQYGSKKWAQYQPTAFICYTAAAYRTADDPRPGIGVAFEAFPGMTPYTHNSELMNAETSAWGRAIVALGAAEAKASADEARNRHAEQEDMPAPPTPVPVRPISEVKIELVAMFAAAGEPHPKAAAGAVWSDTGMPKHGEAESITTAQADQVLAVGSDRARHQIVAPAVTTAVKPPTIPDPAIPDKPVEAVTDAPTASDSIPIDVKARRVAVAAQVKAMALAAVRDQLHGFGVDAGATASESRRLLVDHLVTIPHETADDDIDPF